MLLLGTQVVSWKNGKGEELLFMSNMALLGPCSSKAIYGGISVCSLQFATLNVCLFEEHHGLTRLWAVEPTNPSQ